MAPGGTGMPVGRETARPESLTAPPGMIPDSTPAASLAGYPPRVMPARLVPTLVGVVIAGPTAMNPVNLLR